MHLLTTLVCAGGALVVLADCSGGGGTATPGTGSTVLSSSDLIRREFPQLAVQGSHKPLKAFVNSAALASQPMTIAVSDSYNGVVNIYDPAGNELAQLTGFGAPFGLASDSKGDLYVADFVDHNVQIYAAGLVGAPTVLNDPGNYPVDVDSFNGGRIVAVCNQQTTEDGPGNVEFFTNGQLTNTVSSSFVPRIYGCAFDAVGNLYVAMLGPKFYGRVGEIVGGAHGNKLSLLTTSNSIYLPSGIQVTADGHIAVGADSGFGGRQIHGAVFTYNPPVGGSLGSPVSKTPLLGSNYVKGFAFANDMASLYAASSNNAEAQQFAYPAGGDALSAIDVGGVPSGIAIVPKQ